MINRLIILTGPSGSGKTEIVKALSALGYRFLIGSTTRSPRPGEKDGVDYNFLHTSDFIKKLDNNEFLGYVNFGGSLYGTDKSQLTVLDGKAAVILEPSGIKEFSDFCKENGVTLTKIYVECSDEVRKSRMLASRSEFEVEKRLNSDDIRERSKKIDFNLEIYTSDSEPASEYAIRIDKIADTRENFYEFLEKKNSNLTVDFK